MTAPDPRPCDSLEPCDRPAAPGSRLCKVCGMRAAGKVPKYERERR